MGIPSLRLCKISYRNGKSRNSFERKKEKGQKRDQSIVNQQEAPKAKGKPLGTMKNTLTKMALLGKYTLQYKKPVNHRKQKCRWNLLLTKEAK
jgi:hypothetical protein